MESNMINIENENRFIDIPGYEGYQFNPQNEECKSLNYRRTCKERILKPKFNKGRKNYGLSKNNRSSTLYVSVIIAMVYLDFVPDGHNLVVDHKNNNRFDNNHSNLQIITQRKNISKDIDKTKTSSKYIGVGYNKNAKKWRAQIQIKFNFKNRGIHLGCFNSEEEAYKERLRAEDFFNIRRA